MRKKYVLLIAAAALGLVTARTAGAKVQTMTGLTGIDRGQWELRPRAGVPERICISNGRELIQLRHPRQVCETVVVADEPHDVTVQYTCRGHGYGRTHIRTETPRLVQIDTQGIVDGLPFAFEAEARWVGARCAG